MRLVTLVLSIASRLSPAVVRRRCVERNALRIEDSEKSAVQREKTTGVHNTACKPAHFLGSKTDQISGGFWFVSAHEQPTTHTQRQRAELLALIAILIAMAVSTLLLLALASETLQPFQLLISPILTLLLLWTAHEWLKRAIPEGTQFWWPRPCLLSGPKCPLNQVYYYPIKRGGAKRRGVWGVIRPTL